MFLKILKTLKEAYAQMFNICIDKNTIIFIYIVY